MAYPGALNSAHPLSSDIYIDKGITMHMLYDSESFVVVHMLPDAVEKKGTPVLNDTAPAAPQLARHGFEIVDKRSGKEVYLDGSWAEMFQEQIRPGSATHRPRKKWKTPWTATQAWHNTRWWCTDATSEARALLSRPL